MEIIYIIGLKKYLLGTKYLSLLPMLLINKLNMQEQ